MTLRASTACACRPAALRGRRPRSRRRGARPCPRSRPASAGSARRGSGRRCRASRSSVDDAVDVGAAGGCASSPARDELADRVVVPAARTSRATSRGRGIAVEGEPGAADQQVGDAREGRDHDHRLPVAGARGRARPGRGCARRSPTEVPPNFMTITAAGRGPAAARALRMAAPGGAADRVVDEGLELQVEQRVVAHAAHRHRHAALAVAVEPRLRPVVGGQDVDGLPRARWAARAPGARRGRRRAPRAASAAVALAGSARRRPWCGRRSRPRGAPRRDARRARARRRRRRSVPRIFCGSVSIFSSSPPPM